MEHYAGIDVSLELSSVCVVDALGKIVKEAKVSSEPEALVSFFEALGFAVKRIGLEAGPLSQWLHAGLKRAGFDAVLLETRHVKAASSAMTVRGFGLKVGPVTRKGFEARIRELVMGQTTLERIATAMLSARAALKMEYEKLHKVVLSIVREDGDGRRQAARFKTGEGRPGAQDRVILHRMWVDGTTYRWTDAQLTAAQV
jgi:transposase